MRANIASIILVLLLPTSAFAAGSSVQPNPYFDVPADLAQVVNQYDAARFAKDTNALRSLIANDYQSVDEHAFIRDKAAAIADIADPRSQLKPFVIVQPKHIVWADGAVLAGTIELQWSGARAKSVVEVRYSDIWEKRSGRWTLVFSQLTAIPPPPP